jgi:hypothetical protein
VSLARTWPFAFVVTCLLELPIVVWSTLGTEAKWARVVAVALLGQLLTHPLVWFAFPALTALAEESRFWLSELFAWLAEAALYASLLRGVSPWRAVGVSGLANATSLAAGLLLAGG